MRALLKVVLFLLFVWVIVTLYGLNLEPTQFRYKVTPFSIEEALPTSLGQFGLVTFMLGGLLVLGMVGFRELRHLFRGWKAARRHRAEQKVREWLVEAFNAQASGKSKEAIGWFEKILAIDPNQRTALIRLGTLRRWQGNYQEALRVHRKARSLADRDLECIMAIVDDLEAMRRLEEAVQLLRETLARDKSNRVALTRLRDLFFQLHQWEEAHSLQEQLLEMVEGSSDESQEQARLLGIKYEAGQQAVLQEAPDVARRYFKAAIKLEKGFIPAYVGLGRLLVIEGKHDQASEIWRKAYWTTVSVILLHHLEDLFLEMGDPAGIIDFYRQAISRDPGDPVLQFYLGKLYYRLEMIDESIELLSAIDTSSTHFPDLHKLLGNLSLRRGDTHVAIDEFKKALNLKKRVLVPYFCPQCDYHTHEWSGRCPRCEQWNTFLATPIMMPRMKVPAAVEPVIGSAEESTSPPLRLFST